MNQVNSVSSLHLDLTLKKERKKEGDARGATVSPFLIN
jgi:hypothetical protein